MGRYLRLAALAMAAMSTPWSDAGATVTRRFAYGTLSLVIEGEIGEGDADRFAEEVSVSERSGHPLRNVILETGGGRVLEAFRISLLMKERRMTAIVPSGKVCASACFLPFVAGSPRFFEPGARIGVHSIYTKDSHDRQTDSVEATRALVKYLLLLGTPYTVTNKILGTPGSSVTWLSDDDLDWMNARRFSKPDGEVRRKDILRNYAVVCAMRHLLLGNGHRGEEDYVRSCLPNLAIDPGDVKEVYATGLSGRTVAFMYPNEDTSFGYVGTKVIYVRDGVRSVATVEAVNADSVVVSVDGRPVRIPFCDGYDAARERERAKGVSMTDLGAAVPGPRAAGK